MIETFTTIGAPANTEFKDRGSRFIGYAIGIETADAFKKELKDLKLLHPKAAHHCFAYRLGIDKNNFRSSDDGEPAGSAGKPILGQIDSKEITDAAIVVVRYFGGTLLGVPGLINAYKTTASLVLQICPLISKKVMKKVTLHFNHDDNNMVLQSLKQVKAEIYTQQLQLFCSITAGIPVGSVEYFSSIFHRHGHIELIW